MSAMASDPRCGHSSAGSTRPGSMGKGWLAAPAAALAFQLAACGGGANQAPPVALSSPVITQQPPATVTVFDEMTATIGVTATGTPAPTFQWQVSYDSGATWANVIHGTGGTTEVYTTGLVTVGDDRSCYRVIVSNSQGSVISQSARLQVGMILDNPFWLDASPGDSLVALRWDPVPGASTYRLIWSSKPVGAGRDTWHEVSLPASTLASCSYTQTGLANGTLYYFAVLGVNHYGQEGMYSPDATATPTVGATATLTGAADPVTDNGAWLSGSVNVPVGATVSTWFEWGPTTAYGSQNAPVDHSDPGEVALTCTVAGLTPGSLYHWRVVAQDSSGIFPGHDWSFTTIPAP